MISLLAVTRLARRHPITPAQRKVLSNYATYMSLSGYYKHPTGRAAYVVNRLWQVGGATCTCWREAGGLGEGICHHIVRETLEHCKDSTAQKWGEQFHAGVNLRRSIAAWLVWEAQQESPWPCLIPVQSRDHEGGQHTSRRAADACRARWYRRLRKDAANKEVTP
jgi:hypothetical protein